MRRSAPTTAAGMIVCEAHGASGAQSGIDSTPVLFDDRDFSRINMDVRNGALVPAGTSNNPGSSFFLTPTHVEGEVHPKGLPWLP